MSGLPELPSFLANELRCPLDRCNKPSAFATHIPADLSPALAIFLLRCAEACLWNSCVIQATGTPAIMDAVEDAVVGIALRHESRQDFVDALAKGGDEMAALKMQITSLVRTGIESHRWITFEDGVTPFLEEGFISSLSIGLNNVRMRPCMHIVVEMNRDWRRAGIRAPMIQDPNGVNSVGNRMITESLLRRLKQAIVQRRLTGQGWESSSDWRKVVEKLYEQIMVMATEVMYESVTAGGGPYDGLAEIIDSPDFVLRLLAQDRAPERFSPMLEGVIFHNVSPGGRQLIKLSEAPRDQRRSILNLIPPPSKSLPANIVQSLTPPVNLSSPPSPFQRLKITPTYSERLPFVPIFPLPQCCPPDRCTATDPPIAGLYKTADNSLQIVFQTFFRASVINLILTNAGMVRSLLIELAVSELSSWPKPDLNDALSQTALSAPSSVFALMDFKGKDLLNESIKTLREVIPEIVTASTCRCKLTRCADTLRLFVQEVDAPQKAHIRRSMKSLKKTLAESPVDIEAAVQSIERHLRSGKLFGDCWSGEWKPHFRNWLRRAAEQIDEKLVDQDGFSEYCASFEECWRILGTAALLECDSARLDPSMIALCQYFVDRKSDTATTAADRERLRGKADLDAQSSDITSALHLYESSLLSNASDFQASLNSAAVRLQLANDSDQSFQWSRAISDCTFALYYGGPSFKAYYRRGFALAHLKMYKKAFSDFKQALLIEPGNVLVKQRLASAKKRA